MGNPFVHVELHADDVGAAKKFYKSVFDWKLEDMPGTDYTMIGVGKGAGGGMMKKPMPDQPSAWLPYVEVADVKKTIDKARKAGANVLVPYQSIGDMGAIGVFMDPAGAALGVWELAKKAATPKKAAKKAAKKTGKKAAKKKGSRR
ncbi:MAG TPA: VOC family protein [Polyangiaceae bacterium]|nr:VOC family protein [Polyangiaceae bacterium]